MPAAPPPKKLKSEIVYLNQSLQGIERQQHADIQRAPESMPVLEAFQEYLSQERRRSSRRVAAMVTLFAFILMGLGGVSITVVLLLSDRMTKQAVAFSERTGTLKGELGQLVTSTDDSISGIQATLAALQSGLSGAQQAQQDQLVTGSAVASNLTIRIDDYVNAITTLNAELEALRRNNATVQARLTSITNELSAVATRTVTRLPSASAALTAPVDASVAAGGARSRRLPFESITLPIVPPGETTPVNWRIPLFKRTS